jgi:Fe(3+) dicitrate transport protein
MIIKTGLSSAFLLFTVLLHAQQPDTARTIDLKEILVSSIRTVRGTGHMPEIKDGILYAGKKNEVILVDSLDANKAVNNTRQILGRIPGLNIVETESGGFTANGIATRGLNPSQSIEMNVRQNGYNISADIYGYNEAYYIPPMEAVSRIEMVRGAASLQFGSQFGGLVNYVVKNAPAGKPFEFTTSQTIGSFGLYNAFNSVGGTLGAFSYYGFVQYRYMDGWRPNSPQSQVSGFGKVEYKPSEQLTVGAEYSLLRNKVKMPGGLTDSLFNANPRASYRSRNWLESPWNIISAHLNYRFSSNTSLNIKSSYLFSSRALVWRNEDGGAGAPDNIDPATGEYVPREVENEVMHNFTTEARLLQHYSIGNQPQTLAAGVRISTARFKRQGGGPGTTGSDFDLSISGPYEYDLDFTTTNFAPFVENIFRLNSRLTITPGFRFEHLVTTADGYVTEDERIDTHEKHRRNFPLFGLGAEFKTSLNTNLYANFSQAYRPIDYAHLTPFGITSRIDPNLKDSYGFNADLGYRGTIRNFLNFDLGCFYLAYDQRIGVVLKTDPVSGETYTFRTNIANSVHKGIETYLEFNPVKMVNPEARVSFSVFDAFAYTDARYTSGEYKGNRVETAVKYINRTGILLYLHRLSVTAQMNNTGDAFGDASNARLSDDPVAGYIPAYTVFDLSASLKFKSHYALKAGINNVTDKSYFTRRTDEYPGPGILPAVGRSLYVGITAVF